LILEIDEACHPPQIKRFLAQLQAQDSIFLTVLLNPG
jgi:hypothetical protein